MTSYTNWLARQHATLEDFIRAEAGSAITAVHATMNASYAFVKRNIEPPPWDVMLEIATSIYCVPVVAKEVAQEVAQDVIENPQLAVLEPKQIKQDAAPSLNIKKKRKHIKQTQQTD